MALAERPQTYVEVYKPEQINLKGMISRAEELLREGTAPSEMPKWEVYVRLKYRDSLDYIQKITPDGKVQVVGTRNGSVEHSEYTVKEAFAVLDETIIKVQQPKDYRLYIADFSVINNASLDQSGQADPLMAEFKELAKDILEFNTPATPAIDWEKEAAEKAAEDQARAAVDEARREAIRAEEAARDEAERQALADAAEANRLKAEREALGEARAALWSTNSSGVEPRLDRPVIKSKEDLLRAGFIMEEPEISEEEPSAPSEEPTEAPWLGEQPPIAWPHLEPKLDKLNGNGKQPEVSEVIPEGVKKITYKTKSGKEQTRYKRISDGKFVGSDGKTLEDRIGKEAYAALKAAKSKAKGEKLAKDGVRVKHTDGHKNGNGKGKHAIVDTAVIAQRVPEREKKGTRAPHLEATVPTPEQVPSYRIEVVDQAPNDFIVIRNLDEYRKLSAKRRGELNLFISGLRPEYDLDAAVKEVFERYGVEIDIHPPQKTPVAA